MTMNAHSFDPKGLVLSEKKDDIVIVTVNRPQKRNALNRDVRRCLMEVMKDIEADKTIKVCIITGAGDTFVAGADIAAMKDYDPEDAKAASKKGTLLFSFIGNMRIPVIAAVNGWALGGGCELALACDIRIASEDAKFGQPEVFLGIMPGYGATVRLPRIIGDGRARELIITGRTIDAFEALRLGLVTKVVKKSEIMDEAMSMAKKISRASVAVHFVKKAINRAFDMSLDSALEFQTELYSELYKTHDTKEGISAYLEKRRPRFNGD